MDHKEAIQQMAAERYLLDEMTPELRESFEEHAFDCPECSLDLRAGAAFITVAKAELPNLVDASPTPSAPAPKPAIKNPTGSSGCVRPSPYLPSPPCLPSSHTRISPQSLPCAQPARTAHPAIHRLPCWNPWHFAHLRARRSQAGIGAFHSASTGFCLRVILPSISPIPRASSFGPEPPPPLTYRTMQREPISLVIPGQSLEQGSYTLSIFGITTQGTRTEIDRRILEIHFDE